MTLRVDAASVVIAMGARIDIDFIAYADATGVNLTALNGYVLPSEATINAFDMSPAAVEARENAKEPLLADLKTQASAAVTDNNTYLAIGSPNNAQVLAQVRALTQQNNRIIRGLFRVIQRTWRNGVTPP